MKQDVLAMKLYTADGVEIFDSDDSAVEYAGSPQIRAKFWQ